MPIIYDPAKNQRNLAERALSFDRVAELDWENALIVPDTRRDYGEARERVLGLLEGRLHAAVITTRGDDMRVISFRVANRAERRMYERHIQRQAGYPG